MKTHSQMQGTTYTGVGGWGQGAVGKGVYASLSMAYSLIRSCNVIQQGYRIQKEVMSHMYQHTVQDWICNLHGTTHRTAPRTIRLQRLRGSTTL